MTQNFNPDIHCCERWWKDYCNCVKDKNTKRKQNKINNTLKWLNLNNIIYLKTNVANIVRIQINSKDIFVSLVSKYNLLNVKFEKSNKWFTYSKNNLLKLIKYDSKRIM